jgi:HPr kinase/phosphorylase
MTPEEAAASSFARISVRKLIDDLASRLDVRVVGGMLGLEREIAHARIQKSGLSLVGHRDGVVAARVQVLGETEMSYVRKLGVEQQDKAAHNLFDLGLACVLVTCGTTPPEAFLKSAERTGTPLLVCQQRSSAAITTLHAVLDERLAPRTRMHGVLVDLFEIGVLLLGPSGIGKSEIALELVMRGHRLVADDVVEFDFQPPGKVFGQAAELLRYHMEVRGLGILNIKDLYGVTAIRERKRVDLVVRLELLGPDTAEYDRVGLEDRYFEILGVDVREVRLPVRPGRNIASTIEIAARNELLRQAGHHPAREFIERVEARTNPHDSVRDMPVVRIPDATESSVPPPVTWRRDK